MFYYFPGNYTWSSGFNLALMSGGSLSEQHRWLEPLRDGEPDGLKWAAAWEGMARQQEALAETDAAAGFAAVRVSVTCERRCTTPAASVRSLLGQRRPGAT